METLELSRTIDTLAGAKVSQLQFDFDALTPADYRHIIRLESRLRGVLLEDNANFTKKESSEFRIATAWMAAVKNEKNNICYDDIDRISFADLLELERIGLFFIAHVE